MRLVLTILPVCQGCSHNLCREISRTKPGRGGSHYRPALRGHRALSRLIKAALTSPCSRLRRRALTYLAQSLLIIRAPFRKVGQTGAAWVMERWPSGVAPASISNLMGGAWVSLGQGAAGFADKTVSLSKTWRRPKMKPVLSREEVAALLQGLSQYEPDHKIPEPGPAQERLDSGELRGKKATIPVAERIGPVT
jgi:hypothetical protein